MVVIMVVIMVVNTVVIMVEIMVVNTVVIMVRRRRARYGMVWYGSDHIGEHGGVR